MGNLIKYRAFEDFFSPIILYPFNLLLYFSFVVMKMWANILSSLSVMHGNNNVDADIVLQHKGKIIGNTNACVRHACLAWIGLHYWIILITLVENLQHVYILRFLLWFLAVSCNLVNTCNIWDVWVLTLKIICIARLGLHSCSLLAVLRNVQFFELSTTSGLTIYIKLSLAKGLLIIGALIPSQWAFCRRS